jgi:hypothetical protein
MAQVVPDETLGRRMVRCSIVGEAATSPLMDFGGETSIFSRVGAFRIEGCESGATLPLLRWERPILVHGRGSSGKGGKGKTNVALLTSTSKMTCPSFSLAAGPPEEGGTCLAARVPAGGKGLRVPGRIFVCDGCYALERQYKFQDPNTAQAARAAWVVRRLREDPTGTALARDLVLALVDEARCGTHSAIRDGLAQRIRTEFGVWREGRLWIPVDLGRGGKRREIGWMPAKITPLPPDTGFRDSRAVLAAREPPEEAIAGFFRIHDAGDVTVTADPKLWSAYIATWGMVAAALPHVVFWLPTRAYVLKTLIADLVRAKAAARGNLVVRPSSLHVGDPPPRIPGLDAGTGTLPDAQSVIPGGAWRCPVQVPRWDPDAVPSRKERRDRGERGEFVTDRSCLDAGCRRCWLDPTTAVAYLWKE